ncbi:hypothetical protein ACFQE4_03420 [Streptomyces thermocoprophilus]|uniref:DUF8017 domain-containing protein n=1 Tax=Streptomyces thermocoprophilus TaxID=78356 RepID=A0ABV5VLP2_9ACTN
MWPEQQPPGGNPPQQPNPHPQPNPYRQPGSQEPGPHPAPREAPTVTAAQAGPPDGDRRTTVIAVTAAVAVVLAATVTGALLVLARSDDGAAPAPDTSSASASAAPSTTGNPRAGDGVQPTVPGWKAVVNADKGIAFDVPADWVPRSPDWVSYVADDSDPDEKPLVAMKAPAEFKQNWCADDPDRDGRVERTALASAGSRGNNGARSTEEIARADSEAWVYGAYTQPDRTKVTVGPVTSYTTASGLTGSLATAQSSGVPRTHKCDSDGRATTFAFRLPDGGFGSWSFVGAEGVKEEVPESVVRRILATVRLVDTGDS